MVKDVYTDNCNKLVKEIEDTSKWKAIPCMKIGRINIFLELIFLNVHNTQIYLQIQCKPYQNSKHVS